MTIADQFLIALTAWRENRGGGYSGMQSVVNVIMNRVAARGTTPYKECVRPWQFSSITAKGDQQLSFWPAEDDPSWRDALSIADLAVEGNLPDITAGATSYYALTMQTPPIWAASMTKTVTIQGQVFFK